MQQNQAVFANEAFWFLLNNAHLWIEYPKDILFRIMHCRNCRILTANIKNAIIAQTYVSRIRYRKMASEKREELKSALGYERIISEYPVFEDHYYFYNFLDWVSFIFYLTIFCYKQGYDYFGEGNRCLATYPNVIYFHSVGGWAGFENMSIRISEIVNIMTTACLEERPSDTKLLMFDKRVRKFERRHRYESNKWTQINFGWLKAKYVIKETSAKFRAVSVLDSRRVIPGYKFINTDTYYFKCPEMEVVSQGATSGHQMTEREIEAAISDITMGIYKTGIFGDGCDIHFASNQNPIENTGNEYISEDNNRALAFENEFGIPTEFAGKLDGTKCAFVISERYLRKKNSERNIRSKSKRGIKICSYSQNSDKFVRNLQEILDTNISLKNYRKIDENVLAVCPPDCDYESNDTQIIVLDTSTEEEDDDFDIYDQELPFNIDFFSQQNTDLDVPRSTENSQLSSQSSTDMKSEPTKSTGAIPKVKSSAKKKSERPSTKSTKCPQLEGLQSDLEKFNPSTFQSETGSISTRREEQRQEGYIDEDIRQRVAHIVENVMEDLRQNSLPPYENNNCRDI